MLSRNWTLVVGLYLAMDPLLLRGKVGGLQVHDDRGGPALVEFHDGVVAIRRPGLNQVRSYT